MPADDVTDPAVTIISGHMACVIVLSPALAGQRFYSAIDPLASSSTLLNLKVVGDDDDQIATRKAATGDDLATLGRDVSARFLSEMDEERVNHIEITRLYLSASECDAANAGAVATLTTGGGNVAGPNENEPFCATCISIRPAVQPATAMARYLLGGEWRRWVYWAGS